MIGKLAPIYIIAILASVKSVDIPEHNLNCSEIWDAEECNQHSACMYTEIGYKEPFKVKADLKRCVAINFLLSNVLLASNPLAFKPELNKYDDSKPQDQNDKKIWNDLDNKYAHVKSPQNSELNTREKIEAYVKQLIDQKQIVHFKSFKYIRSAKQE